MRFTERVTFVGPAGILEGIVDDPQVAQAPACAVICHPHPLGGGTMTNKVVHTLARCFQQVGAATLRFNFRGVGASEGQFDNGAGETQDALAAIALARSRWPERPLWLAGFSFGSFVALRAAAQCEPAWLVVVAPPVGRWDFSAIAAPNCPWLIVQGDADELVDASAVRDWAASVPRAPQWVLLAGVDHFFHGRLHDLKDVVLRFAPT